MISDHEWYKHAVFYEVLVRSFKDSNGDGQGDLAGLASKMEYLAWLGVDCVWLPPFFPSPLRDGGYDVSDYTNVAERYGSLADFDHVISTAHDLGLRVIIDFVMNHTSDQHPWFEASRTDPNGPYGDYYVWRDSAEEYADARVIFLDTEPSNWTFDPVRQQYFWHRFFSHQPDLNFDNPVVIDEMLNALRFWLDRGVDGFRLDAVPYLIERPHTNGENLPETHAILKRVRHMIDVEYPNVVLLCEANQWPEDVIEYFGDGDECHMAFNFPVMPRLFMGLKKQDRQCISDVIAATPEVPLGCAWGTFLRNHDELTLEMVTSDEREYMWNAYAPEPRMRANLGIRRRLAPLVDNDVAQVKLLNALLLALPGSPVLYYGDEIGMGDNIWLPDRDGVRTPMQWEPGPQAGFSDAAPETFGYPLITDSAYCAELVNVADQRQDPTSLLNWLRTTLDLRHEYSVLVEGAFVDLGGSNHSVFCFVRIAGAEAMLCAFNLSSLPQTSTIDVSWLAGARAFHSWTGAELPGPTKEPYDIHLPPHGYTWISLTGITRRSADLWADHIQGARWFAGKGREGELESITPLPWLSATESFGWPSSFPAVRPELARIRYLDGSSELYQLIASYRNVADSSTPALGIANVPGLGVVRVGEVVNDPEALAVLVGSFRPSAARLARGWNMTTTPVVVAPDVDAAAEIAAGAGFFAGEQSNSSAFVGPAMVKVIRRLEEGRNLEISTLAALRDHKSVPQLWSYLSAERDGELYDLATLSQRVPDATSGWEFAIDSASRNGGTSWARLLGAALAGIHGTLSERLGQSTCAGANVVATMESRLHEAVAAAPSLAGFVPALRTIFAALADHELVTHAVHGDFHLGQTLISGGEWFVIDFEGEPMKSYDERRVPDSPWRDVAGMLRSFDYARASADQSDAQAAYRWCTQAREAFLAGYAEERGVPITATELAIIRAYEADKAIYEVVYESRNRPAWVAIPMRAVQELTVESTR